MKQTVTVFNILYYYIEYFCKAAGILLLGVWCKNIRYNISIITLVGVWPDGVSPLEKLGHPRVTLLFSGRHTVGSHSNKGDNCILSYRCSIFEESNCIDWIIIFVVYCHWLKYTFLVTLSRFYLLSIVKLVVNQLTSCWQKMSKWAIKG
jgi:hypothetical protein